MGDPYPVKVDANLNEELVLPIRSVLHAAPSGRNLDKAATIRATSCDAPPAPRRHAINLPPLRLDRTDSPRRKRRSGRFDLEAGLVFDRHVVDEQTLGFVRTLAAEVGCHVDRLADSERGVDVGRIDPVQHTVA